MSLTPFNIIVAIDAGNGIAKDSAIPWKSQSDGKFFNTTTCGNGKNVVIMGRLTYESIPPEHRPLRKRKCVVISRTLKQEQHPEIIVCESFLNALEVIGGFKVEEVFLLGGEQLLQEAVRDYLYLCKRIYVTRYKTDYRCDQFFPWDEIKELPQLQTPTKTRDYIRYIIAPSIHHPELTYLSELKRLSEEGESKPSVDGSVITSMFGSQLSFDISERVPILTTRKLNVDSLIKELIFFINGETNIKLLEEQGVEKWKKETRENELIDRNLDYEVGDLGPYFAYQWRKWGGNFLDKSSDGFDQLRNIVENLKNNPHDVHVLASYNVKDLKNMVIQPTLTLQFYVSGDRKFIDCSVTSTISDFIRCTPNEVAYSSLLTYILGHLSGLKPRRLNYICNQAYILNNDNSVVKKIIGRYPRPFPKLTFRRARKLQKLEDFTFDNFIIENYNSCENVTL